MFFSDAWYFYHFGCKGVCGGNLGVKGTESEPATKLLIGKWVQKKSGSKVASPKGIFCGEERPKSSCMEVVRSKAVPSFTLFPTEEPWCPRLAESGIPKVARSRISDNRSVSLLLMTMGEKGKTITFHVLKWKITKCGNF